MGKIKLLIKYLVYRFKCRGPRGYGLHSPFVFEFNRNVLNCRSEYPEYREILIFRKSLAVNRKEIRVSGHGAGSLVFSSLSRKVSEIAGNSASSPETGKLLFRLARHLNPDVIIELGTSVGFGTFCLARGAHQAKVYSLEACPQQIKIAGEGIRKAGVRNVRLIEGTFDNRLPELLNEVQKADLVYFDGDHARQSVLRQYSVCLRSAGPGTVFVIGDIHWSDGMEEAWKIMCSDPGVSLSVDLFYCGLLFFRKGMAKQHYVLGYSS